MDEKTIAKMAHKKLGDHWYELTVTSNFAIQIMFIGKGASCALKVGAGTFKIRDLESIAQVCMLANLLSTTSFGQDVLQNYCLEEVQNSSLGVQDVFDCGSNEFVDSLAKVVADNNLEVGDLFPLDAIMEWGVEHGAI